VGKRLATGEKIDDILKSLGSVAEGVATSKALKSVLGDLKLDLPIANSVRYFKVIRLMVTDANCRCTKCCTKARFRL
jgi:glycerol-3-phosphate dehydrogenase